MNFNEDLAKQRLAHLLIKDRHKTGLSMENYGKRLNVSMTAIRSWECQESLPSLPNFCKLANLLGIRPDTLLAMIVLNETESWNQTLDVQKTLAIARSLSSEEILHFIQGLSYILENRIVS